MKNGTPQRHRFLSRVRALPAEKIQLWATEAIFVFFFLSIWKWKLWYVGTAGAIVVTALLAAIPALKLRRLALDVAPLVVYFVYLYIAAGWSEYAAEARWWAAADSIGIFVFAMFWVAARNNVPGDITQSFVRVMLLGIVALVVTYEPSPYATRFGGYTIPFIPSALPFIWAVLVSRVKRAPAALALLAGLTILLISRSRSPLFTAVIILGLTMLLIGRSVTQRLKLGLALAISTVVVLALLMAYQPTRFFLFTFYSRITQKDVLTSDIYIAAEPEDPTRRNLKELVRDNVVQVQPFGAGYMTTQRYYERLYWQPFALHSIYETWAFEGGLFCVVIVAVILLRHIRGLAFARRFAMTRNEVVLARAIELATLAALLMGLFHQMHHGPILYALLGLALGLRARVLAEHLERRALSPSVSHRRVESPSLQTA